MLPLNTTENHPYLIAKGLRFCTLVDNANNLVCPIYQHGMHDPTTDGGGLLSVELISPILGSPKLKLKGRSCKGGYWLLDSQIGSHVFLVEGFATGVALWELMQRKMPVAVCFGCHNMGAVANDIVSHWKARPVLAPDMGSKLLPDCEGYPFVGLPYGQSNFDWCDYKARSEELPVSLKRILDHANHQESPSVVIPIRKRRLFSFC